MDRPDSNTLLMGFLFTVFVVLGVSFLSELIFHHDVTETKGYIIEIADASADDSQAEAEPEESVLPLLATADLASGEKLAKQRCAACHVFEAGGANKQGPQLYDIVNRPIGGVDGFGYSSALLEYGTDKGWSYEELDGFLKKPNKWIKGTAMGFAGLKKVDDRADLIAYMRTLSEAPAALPSE